MQSVDPRSGEVLKSYEEHTEAQVEAALVRAQEAFARYRRTSFAERARWMARAADLLEAEKQGLARLMTQEMGKTLSSAVAEAEKCAWACRYYVEHAERMLADEVVATGAQRSFVRYQPLGAVLAIMPWNFPFWQAFRFIAPALMAGNVGLLKHASNVPGCALAIEDLLKRAGFPEGVFQTLLVGSKRVKALIEDPRVRAVTLTGSEAAGRSVGEQSGRALKKVVLELGGSDPFIVMASADVQAAADMAVKARVINNGQSCIAAKRFIVAAPVYEAFRERFVKGMEALKVGDPFEEGVQVGPLATASIRDEVHGQVEASVRAGARLLTGGRLPPGKGFFYPPTVLEEVPEGAPAKREEVFGPVAVLFKVKDAEEAVRVANDIAYGLGSSAWTNDAAERERFVEDIEAGMVFINGMVASDPRLPFGGVKASGHGRELSHQGLREFTNAKTVWMAGTQGPQHAGESE
jgi:succinate-semialdehyde dehydrogenase/glutarate-semialdehyde dehydrogenase